MVLFIWDWILICVVETGFVIYEFKKYYTGVSYWTDRPDGTRILDDNPSLGKRLYAKLMIVGMIAKASIRSILNVPGNAMKTLGGILIVVSKFITFQLKSKQDWSDVYHEEFRHRSTEVNVFQKF